MYQFPPLSHDELAKGLVLQTIITTALPTIAADFNASEGDYTWVGSSYLLAAAGKCHHIGR